MDATQLDPFAKTLVSSWMSTASFSQQFREEHDFPPSTAAKAHYFRSVVQARVTQGDRYELHPEFVEFGRVQVTDLATTQAYLLRSMSAVSIETARAARRQLELFAIPQVFDVNLLVYQIEKEGMHLWRCGTTRAAGEKRLTRFGELHYIGFWPFDDFDGDGGEGGFVQGPIDPWDDLGDLDIDAVGA
ncbi:hypothetical protein [Mycolicibacterium parafortuitum]|uniref:hypothetical protein n=1 Tax=Mycolicibacterium parafortuitum TaxID=39692 RepID=UPI0032C472E8